LASLAVAVVVVFVFVVVVVVVIRGAGWVVVAGPVVVAGRQNEPPVPQPLAV